jgi:pimeloyl-ACP methyl ester carboxylesterase
MSDAAPGDHAYRPRRAARRNELECREGRFGVTRWGPDSVAPIVLLHGWMDCGAAWQLLVDQLPDDWPLLALDWRGYGRSARRVERYWFPDHIAELEAVLEVLVPAGPARVIGHSMGGTVAMMYAGIRPGRLAWVVNIEGFGMPELPALEFPEHVAGWLDGLHAPLSERRYASHAELANALRLRNPRLAAAQALYLAAAWTREQPDGSLQMLSDPATELRSPIRYARAQLDACWARVCAPVLLLTGAESRYLERAAGANALARWHGLLPALESVVIPQAGHLLPYEQPQRVAAEILPFVQRCEAGA